MVPAEGAARSRARSIRGVHMSDQVRVALVRLHQDPFDRLHADEHIGIGYLASTLRNHGIPVKIFDNSVAPQSAIHDLIMDYSPDLIGYTVDTENIRVTISFDEELVLPKKALRCWGGHHASLCAEAIIRDGCCDVVVMGDGEDSLFHLVQWLQGRGILYDVPGIAFRHKNTVRITNINRRPITNVPWPARDILSRIIPLCSRISARVLSSRGCPYDCKYCTTPALLRLGQGPKYRVRTPVDFVNELVYLHNNFGVKRFYVNDDLYFHNSPTSKKRALAIAQAILRRNLKIAYKVELRADSFDPTVDISLLHALKRSGLVTVFIGLESGSDDALSRLGKETTTSQNRAAVNTLREVGIRVNVGRILFGPDSTWLEIEQSIDMFHDLKCCHQVFRHPGLRLRAFPGTLLARDLQQQGRLQYEDKTYYEATYAFSNKTIEAFCDELSNLYDLLWPLVRSFFDERSFQQSDHHLIGTFENLCYHFLHTNVSLRDGWNKTAFTLSKETFLSNVKKLFRSS